MQASAWPGTTPADSQRCGGRQRLHGPASGGIRRIVAAGPSASRVLRFRGGTANDFLDGDRATVLGATSAGDNTCGAPGLCALGDSPSRRRIPYDVMPRGANTNYSSRRWSIAFLYWLARYGRVCGARHRAGQLREFRGLAAGHDAGISRCECARRSRCPHLAAGQSDRTGQRQRRRMAQKVGERQ